MFKPDVDGLQYEVNMLQNQSAQIKTRTHSLEYI